MPLISIITPALNSEKSIMRALESVSCQDGPSFEHIIVDGGSVDQTVPILKKYQEKYPLRWISEKDDGIASALNKGFAMATGEIVAWLDADNRFEPGIFKKIAKVFEEENGVDIVYGNIKIVYRDKLRDFIPPRNISFYTSLMKTTGAIPPQPCVFFRKTIFTRARGFDPRYKVAIDLDFWMRVLKANPSLYYLDETFGHYYRTRTATSQSLRGFMHGFREVYEIADNNGQKIGGKLMLLWKYTLGLISLILRHLLP